METSIIEILTNSSGAAIVAVTTVVLFTRHLEKKEKSYLEYIEKRDKLLDKTVEDFNRVVLKVTEQSRLSSQQLSDRMKLLSEKINEQSVIIQTMYRELVNKSRIIKFMQKSGKTN